MTEIDAKVKAHAVTATVDHTNSRPAEEHCHRSYSWDESNIKFNALKTRNDSPDIRS